MRFSESQIVEAIDAALSLKRIAASTIFIPPQNHRGYPCSEESCSRPAYAKGFCNAHYLRNRAGKSMDSAVRARKRDDLCAECGKLTGEKGGWGLCPKHYRKARVSLIKDTLILLMGSKCFHCNQSFHRSVFDFHHLSGKSESPSFVLTNASPKRIASELSKCILLCANCHRLEHHDDI